MSLRAPSPHLGEAEPWHRGVWICPKRLYTEWRTTDVCTIVQCKINLRQTLAILVGRELASNLSSPCSTNFDKYVEKKGKKRRLDLVKLKKIWLCCVTCPFLARKMIWPEQHHAALFSKLCLKFRSAVSQRSLRCWMKFCADVCTLLKFPKHGAVLRFQRLRFFAAYPLAYLLPHNIEHAKTL